MPLLKSHADLAAANIADLTITARSHYAAAAGMLNNITASILALNNDDLAAFGNALGPAEMQALTSAHGQQGEAVNALIAGVNEILGQSGIGPVAASVDVRPLSVKLAEQGREIVVTDGLFSVVDLPAEPQPEA